MKVTMIVTSMDVMVMMRIEVTTFDKKRILSMPF